MNDLSVSAQATSLALDELSAQKAGREELGLWRKATSVNRFDSDPWFQSLLGYHLRDQLGELEPRLHELGERLGDDLDQLVREDNRDENLPVVRRHDRFGRAREEVVFHPAHHEIGRIFWGSGVLAALAEPGGQRLSGALAYLLDQHGEAGHACPVACTAGAILLLQRVGTEEQKRRYLSGLLETDYDSRLHAAQLVTEVQGGSDVGSNGCIAEPVGSRSGFYRIYGEKWFCSVADAGIFVVSARPRGARPGTRGLGLFLVPRLIDGAPNQLSLRRLKYKLGTRSMPTGEIDFNGALAEPIGSLDKGFKNLISIVLDTSRVHNAIAAAGICRRATSDSLAYAAHRSAFGQPIVDFPSVREILAKMRLSTMAALASTFRVLAMSDRIDKGLGSEDLVAARRLSVMINKYWTARAATATTRNGIEILGGNGTIEDFSALPRLYRDAIVIESWEGTHNTLCAQVLRDMATRGLHESWLMVIDREIEAIEDGTMADVAGQARQLYDQVAAGANQVLQGTAETASAQIRTLVDMMCRLVDWVSLATQLQWEQRQGVESCTAEALELYRLLWLDRSDPLESPEMIELHQRLGRPD